MGKIVLLNKNGHCKTVSVKKTIDIDDVKYILIPLNGVETHIMLKPNEYINFTKAIISYTLEIVTNELIDDEYSSIENLNEVTVEVDNVIDLYSLLHSLNRIEYTNSFISENDIYNQTEGSYLHVSRLTITIFKGDEFIYYLDYISKKCIGCFMVEHYDLFDALKPIYSLYKNKGKRYLNIKSNQWSLVDYPEKDSLVGIYLDNTNSLYIVPDNILRLLSIVSSIEYRRIIFNTSLNKNGNEVSKLNKKIEECVATEDSIDSFINMDNVDLFVDVVSMIESSRPFDKFGDISPSLQKVIEFFVYIQPLIINNVFIFEKLYGYHSNDYTDIIIMVNIYFNSRIQNKMTLVLNKNTNISLECILKQMISQM